MEKKKTKLRKLDMTSVDLVQRGANQKADIRLYKSADDQEEAPHGLLKSIQEAVKSWFIGTKAAEDAKDFEVEKSTFMEALDFSMNGILNDDTMDSVAKAEMAEESIDQFCEAMKTAVHKAVGTPTDEEDSDEIPDDYPEDDPEEDPEDNQDEETEELEEGEEHMRIDKSRFDENELAMYQALIAKGMVEEEETEKQFPPKKKSVPDEVEAEAELHPEVEKALKEVEEMKKNFEMRELTEVAKKYAPLGKKADELTETLYTMKKSSPEAYNSYVAVLDEQLDLVNKSGMFEEIGKSGHGYGVAGGDTVGKIESIATEIMKSAPDMSRHEAVMKAWDQHPELLADYESKYRG